jgi:anti-sigma B factor antagonist
MVRAMDFLIEHDPLDHAHLVTAAGELDVAAAPQLSAILTMGVAGSSRAVVLDMTGATFIDSTALGVVIRAADELANVAKRLFVVAPEGPVSRLLELTNLKQHFAVYTSRDEAVAAAEAVAAR